MFGAGAPLMGAGGQGFDPRRMMGGPQAGNTPGQNPFGRGSSGGADQFGIGGGPGGGPGGSAMASGGAPPWAQGPPGLQGGPGGGPAPPGMGPGGGMTTGLWTGPDRSPPSPARDAQANQNLMANFGGGYGMAGGNMGPGGSGGIFAGGGYGQMGGGELRDDMHGGPVPGRDPGQLGMNVQGGNMGPKPMSPIGAGAYGQAGGNMGPGGGQMDQMAQASRPPGPGGPTGSMDNMRARLQAGGLDPATIDRRVQMAQQGKLPWQQAQGQQGGGATTGMDAQGAPVTGQPAPGRPRLINRGVPGGPVTGMNTRGENPFGRGSSGGAGASAVDDGSNGGGPSSAGEAGSTSRLDVMGGRGAAVRPRNPGPGGGGPAPPRGGIADGRPTPRPMKPGISAPGGMSGGMKPGATGVSGGDFKDTRPAGVDTKPQGTGGVWDQPAHTMGGAAKRQSMAGKAFGKLKA